MSVDTTSVRLYWNSVLEYLRSLGEAWLAAQRLAGNLIFLEGWGGSALPCHISWPIWGKFGKGDLHVLLLRDWELRENRYCANCTLLKEVNEILRIFYILWPIWIKFGARSVHKNVLKTLCVESWCSERCCVLSSINGMYTAVGITTRYGLDGPGIESRWRRDFSHPSCQALGPTQPPIQWAPGLSWG